MDQIVQNSGSDSELANYAAERTCSSGDVQWLQVDEEISFKRGHLWCDLKRNEADATQASFGNEKTINASSVELTQGKMEEDPLQKSLNCANDTSSLVALQQNHQFETPSGRAMEISRCSKSVHTYTYTSEKEEALQNILGDNTSISDVYIENNTCNLPIASAVFPRMDSAQNKSFDFAHKEDATDPTETAMEYAIDSQKFTGCVLKEIVMDSKDVGFETPSEMLPNKDHGVVRCSLPGNFTRACTSQPEWQWLDVDPEISLKCKSYLPEPCKPFLLQQDIFEEECNSTDATESSVGPEQNINTNKLEVTPSHQNDLSVSDFQNTTNGYSSYVYDHAAQCPSAERQPIAFKCTENLVSREEMRDQHPSPGRNEDDLGSLDCNTGRSVNTNIQTHSVISESVCPYESSDFKDFQLIEFESGIKPFIEIKHEKESHMDLRNTDSVSSVNDAQIHIKTETDPDEEHAIFFPASKECSAIGNGLLDIKKEFNKGSFEQEDGGRNLLTVKAEPGYEFVSSSAHSKFQGPYQVTEITYCEQKRCEVSHNEEIPFTNSDDDDVIVLEFSQQEATYITIDDSSCSTEEKDSPFITETRETESESGSATVVESPVQDIFSEEPNLSFSFSQHKPILPTAQLVMDKKNSSSAQKSRTKDRRHPPNRPDLASHSDSPRSAQSKQQRTPPKIFEPYWSAEAVGDGIKRGELIVGPIRINPKNYEDAYIPLPDGKSDLFIGGLVDRNRALNSDIVVVQPYPKDKWRVFVEEFEFYEKTQMANGAAEAAKSDNDHNNDDDDGGGEDSDDSGPDVIFETDSENEVDAAISKELQQSSGTGEDQAKLEQAVADLNISTAGEISQEDKKMMSKIAKVVNRINSKKETPTPKKKKFSSVSEMAKSGSTLAKNLFSETLGPREDGKSLQFVQQTGKVVYIYERKHSRAASGRLKLMPDKNKNMAFFSPTDSRVPRIHIPMSECPKDFYQRPGDYASTLYIARIVKWEDEMRLPQGSLARSLGEAGQIEPETQAMLIEMDVDDSPFSEQVERCLPTDLPWKIPESELQSRKDMRKSCVFTIDPATARDLDDALSIEEVGGGKYEVGVHIADVSYFVTEGTALDEVASQRATSCYLVQKVVPMLPRLLCEELCSLNPDHDRLAFSVIWVINGEGEIFSEWYGRSVIRSCVKLSYDHAQGFIDEPDRDWRREELPPITNSFGVDDIKKRVLQLNKIALNLRKQRFDNGALRLDQVKLQYSLNSDTGLPNGYSIYQQKDSNRLIEEFMLLANMAVAHKITKTFPDKAVLRRHPPPQVKPLMQVEELCENLGLEVDAGTAGSLQRSLWKHFGEDEFSQARLQVLIVLISKPMQNAKYFCSGIFPDDSLYHHYALNVPLYTHFTSPIRRYPDVMVHRLLAASLGYCDPPEESPQILHRRADYCNDKKLNAKMASERSSDMYFSIFVKEAGPLEEAGMVMAVLDKSFDVLILKLGVVKRVYLERLPLRSHKFRKNMKCPELEIEWRADETCDRRTRHLITLFTMVECKVFADKEPLRCSCVIKRPKDEIKFVTPDQ
ncbi:DIS3-like exonuclease 2 [Elysia marginata]|uniref:DIS3-like exonuclease 2 n=1 Tax=Elysia marginata TaxID=1093978 RepID=A0AAV4IFQ6_9GAST|nr:DIS3-like exonuclease 2 [Elysia marginata]